MCKWAAKLKTEGKVRVLHLLLAANQSSCLGSPSQRKQETQVHARPWVSVFSCTLISLENAVAHLRSVSGWDCKKIFCKSLEINVLQSEDRWGMVCWFYSFYCGLLIGVGFQSQNLTLEGEIICLIRNVTSSEINCKAGNSNRLIDITISISLDKGPERWVPYLSEILCSSADLTASLFQWSKSIYIF